MASVLLVDDDPAVVRELAAFLERAGYEVAGVGDLASAERALASRELDALVLDVALGPDSGVAWLSATGWALRVPTLLLSGVADFDEVLRGIVVGAVDFVHKTDPLEALALAIESTIERADARDGDATIDLAALELGPEVGADALEELLRAGRLRYVAELSSGGARTFLLEELADALPFSTRERQVLELLALGQTTKEIAFELGIAPPRVSTLLDTVRRTMGFHGNRQLRRLVAAIART